MHKALWQDESVTFVDGNEAKFKAPKAPWEALSITSQDIRVEHDLREAARNYKVKALWDPPSVDDLAAAFDRQLEAQDGHKIDTPFWMRDDLPADDADAAEAVSVAGKPPYVPLWAEEPISEVRLEQIRSYKIETPFQTDTNVVVTPKVVPPKPYTPTVPPYLQGGLPGAPVPELSFPQPTTSLWTISEDEKTKIQLVVSSGDPILDSLRQQLRNSGADGICGLARKFKIMDDDQSGMLDAQEFRKAMRECRLNLTERQLKHLFSYFDKDDSGGISYDEFLVGIRGVLNSRRKEMVRLAFNVLDTDGSGQVDIFDFRKSYNCANLPEVLAGKMTEEQCLLNLMSNFEVGGDVDGIIKLEEFENYYSNVSASVDSDDYFELMIRNAWHISGGEGACANSTNKRVLVTHADGTQTVEEVKNDMGLKAGDKKGLVNRLRAQGLAAAAVNTDGAGGTDQAADSSSRRGSGTSAEPKAPAASSITGRPVPLSLLAAPRPIPNLYNRPNGSVGSAGSTPRSHVSVPTLKGAPLGAYVDASVSIYNGTGSIAQGSGVNAASAQRMSFR